MIPARARKTLKFPWEHEWGHKPMIWMFLVLGKEQEQYVQLLRMLAPYGYRLDADEGDLADVEDVLVLALPAQLTLDELYVEIMRVHKACDELGMEGLDDVDVGEVGPQYFQLN